jgi:hypothetical protein
VKSTLRKRLQYFINIELPLLLEKGLFPAIDDLRQSLYNHSGGNNLTSNL